MVPGQTADDRDRRLSGQRLQGHVQSIGAGTGSEFAMLPAQNANGNWVKVTQRVPVRIAFDGNPGKPMIAGLSADRHRLSRRLGRSPVADTPAHLAAHPLPHGRADHRHHRR